MRVRFLVLVAAPAAEKEQNFLRVWHSHFTGFVPANTSITSSLCRSCWMSNALATPLSFSAEASACAIPCVRGDAPYGTRTLTPRPTPVPISPMRTSDSGSNFSHIAFWRQTPMTLTRSIASGSWTDDNENHWPEYAFISSVKSFCCSSVSVRGSLIRVSSRFAFAASRFASSARAFASAIARSLACFSSRLRASVNALNWRLIRREAMEVRPPTPANTAPMTTSQNENESQIDADDSSDVTISIALCTLLFTTLIALFRNNSR